MASWRREREQFIAAMAAEGVPYPVTATVLRNAATIQRLAELACSSEAADRDRVPCPGGDDSCLCRDHGDFDHDANTHGTVPRYVIKDQRAEERIRKALEPYHVEPDFQGDPRGACVKLRVPSGKTDDWGRTGLCVPARGY